MTSRVAEMARQAAAEVRTRGLVKGTSRTLDGRMCAVGLIRFVDSGSPFGVLDEAGDALWEALRRRIGTAYRGLFATARWNDAPERTAEDVALMFERVAEQFESAGAA